MVVFVLTWKNSETTYLTWNQDSRVDRGQSSFLHGRFERALLENPAKRLKKKHIKLDQACWNLNLIVLEANVISGISSQQFFFVVWGWGRLKSTQKKLEWLICPAAVISWRLKSKAQNWLAHKKSGKLTGTWKQFLFLACRMLVGDILGCDYRSYFGNQRHTIFEVDRIIRWGIPNFLFHTKLVVLLSNLISTCLQSIVVFDQWRDMRMIFSFIFKKYPADHVAHCSHTFHNQSAHFKDSRPRSNIKYQINQWLYMFLYV